MRYARLSIAALVASAIAVGATTVAVGATTVSLGGTRANAVDIQTLTTMSDSYIIEMTFLSPIVQLTYNDDKTAIMAEIARMAPDVRNLFWLSYLLRETPTGDMHYFFSQAAEERQSYGDIAKQMGEQGKPETDKAVQSLYDEARKTDPSPHADAVAAALVAAGLTQQAKAFDAARAQAAINPLGDFSASDTAFGSMKDFRRAIRDYAERTPSLVDWCRNARTKMSDEDRLGYLTDQLAAMDDKEIDRLPKALKEIFVTDDFNGEMLNGSVEQFFFNSSGQYAPEVVDALRDIGLPDEAAAVQRGIDLFDKPYPTDTQLRRKLYFNEEESPLSDKLDALTGDVDDGTITPALIALAKRENLLPH